MIRYMFVVPILLHIRCVTETFFLKKWEGLDSGFGIFNWQLWLLMTLNLV